MANQLILGRALDANGYLSPGAKATVYADGTSTLITVYSDVDGTTPAANPIIADGDGFWPQRYVSEDAKVVVTDANDVALYTLDPAPTAQGTGAAASAISFAPTIQLPQTNVQAAIEAAGALAVSGFAALGLGVTGNAALLANLDATGTGAGIYRFDGTTTGTYPTGVAAGDTGMVELWRQGGATAMMELHHATTNRVFRRRLTATVWGAWRETVNVNQATAEGDIVYRGASDWARLPKGTARQSLAMNAGATAPEWGPPGGWTESAVVATTSGTAIDYASIPSGVRSLKIHLQGVGFSAGNNLLIRIGPSAGIEETGYISGSAYAGSEVASTVGYIVSSGVHFGTLLLLKVPGANRWTISGNLSGNSSGNVLNVGGTKEIAGALSSIRLLGASGGTFNAGAVTFEWEF